MGRVSSGGTQLTSQEVILIQNLQAGTYENVSTADGTITGAIDGVNMVFTLPAAPSPASSLQLFYGPGFQNQVAAEDYVLVGATITMNIPPVAGSGPLTAFFHRDSV